ncbi:hypothetical protein CEXT_56981, partial [Caerostris extrusa]
MFWRKMSRSGITAGLLLHSDVIEVMADRPFSCTRNDRIKSLACGICSEANGSQHWKSH